MNQVINNYNHQLSEHELLICEVLATEIYKFIDNGEDKLWHAHPVWFINNNPIVGYSKQKSGIRFMFWSGLDFNEEALDVRGKKFKDASIFFSNRNEIVLEDLHRWLKKSIEIQWDYKNLVKRKGVLIKLE